MCGFAGAITVSDGLCGGCEVVRFGVTGPSVMPALVRVPRPVWLGAIASAFSRCSVLMCV